MEARGARIINAYDIFNKDADISFSISNKNGLVINTIFVRISAHLWSSHDSTWQCLFNTWTDRDLCFFKRTIFII